MRVLHIITGLDMGGAENMLFRLIENSQGAGVEQAVISLTGMGVFGPRIEALGVRVCALGARGPAQIVRGFLAARKFARAFAPDLIQSWLHHADLFGTGLVASGVRAPLVWNLRCADLSVSDMPESNRRLVRLLARLSGRPNAVVANSRAGQRSHAEAGYHPRRWDVIGNGFDLHRFAPDPAARAKSRAAWGVTEEVAVVGMVGRYHAVKGYPVFAKAAAELLRHLPTTRFVLAGTGLEPGNQDLMALLEREGLANATILLGPQQDVPGVMNGLDLLASCSTTEGFPNVIGEAMACGVPVVATDAGDSALIVDHADRIVSIGDAEGMAAAGKKILALPLEARQALRERVRHQIVSRYDIRVVARLYEQLYRDVVQDGVH